MASDLDGIASFQVFTLNAYAKKPAEAGGLHRPDPRCVFVGVDFDVEPGMGDEIMDFGHLAFHRRPFCRVVIAVRMVRQQRHYQEEYTNSCKLQGLDEHDRSPYVSIIIRPALD